MTPKERDAAMDEFERLKKTLASLHEELNAAELADDNAEAEVLAHDIMALESELADVMSQFPECR